MKILTEIAQKYKEFSEYRDMIYTPDDTLAELVDLIARHILNAHRHENCIDVCATSMRSKKIEEVKVPPGFISVQSFVRQTRICSDTTLHHICKSSPGDYSFIKGSRFYVHPVKILPVLERLKPSFKERIAILRKYNILNDA